MSFAVVAALDELADGPLGVEIDHPVEGSVAVALVKSSEGEIFALRDECSHAHVALSEGEFDDKKCALECYLHGAYFDVRTGTPLNPPASQPVPVYPVRVEDDQILVDIENPLKEN